ncbi:MAG: aminotransferase class III-fold pyridoxal phosphate-dependent enzyme [Planctomycetota bacterium]
MDINTLIEAKSRGICDALLAARDYLASKETAELLARVGTTIDSIPSAQHLDKRFIQASYVTDKTGPPDDLLTGRGLFYITEQRRLFLDCTAGHYQMTWGYNHPDLNDVIRQALDAGIVWDDHSNIPGNPVKRLSERLVEATGGALDTVNLGVCTGSLAAGTALKIALKHHEKRRPNIPPVFVTVNGNYHGTDFLTQRLRGMWERYLGGLDVASVEPNDLAMLRDAFHRSRGRVVAFFSEPILMNREAILIEKAFMHEARALCDEADACMVIDEIQTCFWRPDVFMFREYDLIPDMLVVGKGMTAGFHPLSALVYRRKFDCLEQYDALCTNGNAPLAALLALACFALLEENRNRVNDVSAYYFARLQEIPAAHPKVVAAIHGKGLLAGIKFRTVEAALEFHRCCVAAGLWVRVHAYHEGHSTVLTKLGLLADRQIADFVVDRFIRILAEMSHG